MNEQKKKAIVDLVRWFKSQGPNLLAVPQPFVPYLLECGLVENEDFWVARQLTACRPQTNPTPNGPQDRTL